MAPYYSRRRPVHMPPVQRDGRPVIVFLTVCTKDRKPVLARPEVHRLLRDVWQEAASWLVGRYVIMPDHLHLFCAPGGHPVDLARWVTYWKSLSTRRWPWPEEKPVWQRDFWDTQLRRGEKYEEKWAYVLENPVRKGLVKDAAEWPYAGELNVLPW